MRVFPRSRARLALAGILLVITGVLALRITSFFHAALQFARMVQTRNEAAQITTAIRDYEVEYGLPPPASDNAAYIRVLTHDNPRGITYLSPSKRELNARGEMIDGWGNSFRVFVDPDGRPSVTSPALLHSTHWKRVSDADLYRPRNGAAEQEAQSLDGLWDAY
jgi:type II secretory pathway pseudopilin PulG